MGNENPAPVAQGGGGRMSAVAALRNQAERLIKEADGLLALAEKARNANLGNAAEEALWRLVMEADRR